MVEPTSPGAGAPSWREPAAQLAALQQALGIVTWVWDVAAGRVDWYGDLSPLLGLAPGDFSGWFPDFLRALHPDDRQPSRERFIACLKGLRPNYRIEERVLWPDGSLHWLETSGQGTYGAEGRALRIVGVVRDITDRKRADGAIVASEERLRRLVEAAPVAIGMSRGDLIVYGNPRFFELYRADTPEQLLGRPVLDLVAPDSREAFVARSARRLAASDAEPVYEMTSVRLDGSEFACQVSVAGAVLAEGDVTLVFLQDISERQRAEQAVRALNAGLEARVVDRTRALEASNAALVQARDAAESATRAKAAFLATMSHEIRTPLNAILGLTDLALRQPALPAKVQGYLAHIHGAGESLLGVVNDILDFSKIESGKLEIEASDFELDEVLARVVSLVALKAADKGLDFLVASAGDVPQRLSGDAQRLTQVLINLCSNAVKFTERGEVVVEVAVVHRQPDTLTLRFSVRDTGIGIAPLQQARLFSPFEQLDASSPRRFEGTGLGLAICRELVTMMGGEIGVHSRPGAGSEFHFTLPLRWPQQAAAPDPRPRPPALRVLVLDDSASARGILQRLLPDLGCRCTAVATVAAAHRALADAADAPYALVLLDARLAEADAFEVARQLRAGVEPAPAVVLIVAGTDEALARRARLEGLAGPLGQPVTAGALAQLLRQLHEPPPAVAMLPEPAARAGDVPRGIAGRRLLLVEDNPLNQIVASELLTRVAGAQLVIAADGRQALERVAQQSFDLVLMDVEMPQLDGREATRLMRQLPRAAGLPILAMTAHASARNRELCLAAGMNDFISKPFQPRELFAMIARWLPDGTASPWAVDIGGGLQRCLGSDTLYRRIAGVFISSQQHDARLVGEAVARGDFATVGAVTHGLAASAGTVGADTLAALARELHRAADERDGAACADLLPRFEQQHRRALAELAEHLGRGDAG